MPYRRRPHKPPVTDISVIMPESNKQNFEIHFTYDQKIVKLMQNLKTQLHAGRYQKYPVPHWEFPISDQRSVIEYLKSAHLHVRIFKRRDEFPQDADVVSILGTCKKCGRYAFCGRDGLCPRCI